MNTDHDQLQLDDSDLISTTWLKVKEHLDARIAILRRRNDSPMSPEHTAHLRGEIAALKNLLAAGESRD